ncbi:hypothetical protein SLS62_009795 [Diatrype stigma]|uniref:Uncharacterized protein n=1 Tax=Diatrype stigma TaxID=117547 RepID=A0AAN9UCP7_9PEZI
MAGFEDVLKRAGGPDIDTEDSLSTVDADPTSKEIIRTTAAVGPAVSGTPLISITYTTTMGHGYTRTYVSVIPFTLVPSRNNGQPTATTTDDEEPTTTSTDDEEPTETSTGHFIVITTTLATDSDTTIAVTGTIFSSITSESSASEITSSITDTLIEADPTGGSQTAPALPSATSPPDHGASPEAEGEAQLPTPTIVGVSVGCGAGGLLALFGLFWLYRRFARAKRASSVRDASSPKYDDDKFVGTGTSLSRPTGLSKSASELNETDDVFAPFGGRANSQRGLPNPLFSNPATAQTNLGGSSTRGRMSVADSYLNSPTSASSGNQPVSPLFPTAAGNDATREGGTDPESTGLGHEARPAVAKELTMVRPESQPRCIELDSGGDGASATGTAAPSELPTPSPAVTHPNSGVSGQAGPQGPPRSKFHDARSRLSIMAMTHPAPLVPGFAGSNTQTSIQSRIEDAASPGEQQQQDDSELQRRDIEFRANLNPTEDERDKNQHVTSWEKL